MSNFRYASVCITHDNCWVIAGTEEGPIFIWDIETGELVDRIEHYKGVVFRLDISPNGHLIAPSDTENVIKIWNRNTRKIVTSLSHEAQFAWDVLFVDDETLCAGLIDDRFLMWNIVSGQQIYALDLDRDKRKGGLLTVSLAPDRETLAVGYGWGLVEVWNIKTSTLLYTHKHQVYHMGQVRFSQDGKYLLVTADSHLSILDRQTGILIKELTDLYYDHGVFSSDGRYILAAVHDTKDEIYAALWDWQTHSTARTFGGHQSSVDAVAMSFDGQLFATAGYDGRIIVRNTTTGNIIRQFDLV